MRWTWQDVQALPTPVYRALIEWAQDEAAGGDSVDLTDLEP